MAELTSFDRAAAWLLLPEGTSPEAAQRAVEALEGVLGDGVPTLCAVAADEPAAATRNPLIPIGIYIAKKAIDGAAAVIKDEYQSEKEAREYYDKRAKDWLDSRR